MSICYHSIIPTAPPVPQHLVGDPGGFPDCWAEGHAEGRRCWVGVSAEAREPRTLWDFYKVLRIPALCYIKSEVLEMGGV